MNNISSFRLFSPHAPDEEIPAVQESPSPTLSSPSDRPPFGGKIGSKLHLDWSKRLRKSMFDAAKNDKWEDVKTRLEDNKLSTRLAMRPEDYFELLSAAVAKKHPEIAELLLKKIPDANVERDGLPIMHNAIRLGYLEVVNGLLEKGGSPDAELNDLTALHLTAHMGKPEMARSFLEKGADVNKKNSQGFTPLHVAAYQGNLAVAKMLVEGGADIHNVDSKGFTPLHYAADARYTELESLLLTAGATPSKNESPSTLRSFTLLLEQTFEKLAKEKLSGSDQYVLDEIKANPELLKEDGYVKKLRGKIDRIAYETYGRSTEKKAKPLTLDEQIDFLKQLVKNIDANRFCVALISGTQPRLRLLKEALETSDGIMAALKTSIAIFPASVLKNLNAFEEKSVKKSRFNVALDDPRRLNEGETSQQLQTQLEKMAETRNFKFLKIQPVGMHEDWAHDLSFYFDERDFSKAKINAEKLYKLLPEGALVDYKNIPDGMQKLHPGIRYGELRGNPRETSYGGERTLLAIDAIIEHLTNPAISLKQARNHALESQHYSLLNPALATDI